MKNKISIIIPAYNEKLTLKDNMIKIVKHAKKYDGCEIIITEDGSTDGTDMIAAQLSKQNKIIKHLHSNRRLGKGLAIKKAIETSNGEILFFMDADLSTSLIHISQFIKLIQKGYDMVIASRNYPGSYVNRSFKRSFTSFLYNLIVRLLFQDGIRDHQTGFKAFKKEFIKKFIDDIESNFFFFDTELIIMAKRMGGKIAEIPVIWSEPQNRTSTFRLLKDGMGMGITLIKFRLRKNKLMK